MGRGWPLYIGPSPHPDVEWPCATFIASGKGVGPGECALPLSYEPLAYIVYEYNAASEPVRARIDVGADGSFDQSVPYYYDSSRSVWAPNPGGDGTEGCSSDMPIRCSTGVMMDRQPGCGDREASSTSVNFPDWSGHDPNDATDFMVLECWPTSSSGQTDQTVCQ